MSSKVIEAISGLHQQSLPPKQWIKNNSKKASYKSEVPQFLSKIRYSGRGYKKWGSGRKSDALYKTGKSPSDLVKWAMDSKDPGAVHSLVMAINLNTGKAGKNRKIGQSDDARSFWLTVKKQLRSALSARNTGKVSVPVKRYDPSTGSTKVTGTEKISWLKAKQREYAAKFRQKHAKAKAKAKAKLASGAASRKKRGVI